MTIKCITFDLDDTLWACAPALTRAEKACYDWFNQYYPKITARYNEQQLLDDRQHYMHSHPDQAFNLTQIRYDWLAQLANTFSYPPQMVEDAYHIFWLERNKVTFFEGALTVLAQLSQQFSLGTISNGNADIHHMGIGHYFDFSVDIVAVGVAKPDPKTFHHAVQLAHCKAGEILHIGDHPQIDVLGALNAGLHAIWYNPHQEMWLGDIKPTGIIRQLDEVQRLACLIE
ncbi:MAG: HAD family hydrolase [Cocleimonas sp.]|nr:HAD family hydrolase [Cocleimonas sp.]